MKSINYNTFKNIIREIVTNSLKQIVTEGISHTVFHFCPLNSLYFIAKNDAFKCTSSDHNRSDQVLTSVPTELKTGGERYFNAAKTKYGKRTKLDASKNKIYNYYMCVSRTPYSRIGYQGRRRSEGGGWAAYCRIELDGRLLANNLKGMPVNYYTHLNNLANPNDIKHYLQTDSSKQTNIDEDIYATDSTGKYALAGAPSKVYLTPDEVSKAQRGTWLGKLSTTANDKPMIKRTFVPYNNGETVNSDDTDMRQMSEYEDRIYSNKEFIENFSKYVVRVDVYIPKSQYTKAVDYELRVIQNKFGDKLFIYDNEAAFNTRNIRYSINKGITHRYDPLNKSFIKPLGKRQWNVNLTKRSEINNVGVYFAGLVCDKALATIGKSAKDFRGKVKKDVEDIVKQYCRKYYHVLIVNLGLTGDGLNIFKKAFRDTRDTILLDKYPYSRAISMIRTGEQRLTIIDGCNQEIIQQIKTSLNL